MPVQDLQMKVSDGALREAEQYGTISESDGTIRFNRERLSHAILCAMIHELDKQTGTYQPPGAPNDLT